MKINLSGTPKVIMSNEHSLFNYFGWPTATRLQNGKIAVVASGFRRRHVCAFGKTVIAYSENDGKTYTQPAPIIDTPLDDRDGGVACFGKSGVIVTSFNNTTEFQRDYIEDSLDSSYLDCVTPQQQEKYLGSLYRVSKDCGVTFGEIYKCPVTSPHGPMELRTGEVIWVGRSFSQNDAVQEDDCIKVYRLDVETGETQYMSTIENIEVNGIKPLLCEPHAIETDDGKILVHIRVDHKNPDIFSLYQTESLDGGKTWTTPHRLLHNVGGSPPHIMKHSSGALICTYGFRGNPFHCPPFGVKAMFSFDNGKTWDVDCDIYVDDFTHDLGYPSTVELEDGSLITVFYAHSDGEKNAVIMQQKWSFK